LKEDFFDKLFERTLLNIVGTSVKIG